MPQEVTLPLSQPAAFELRDTNNDSKLVVSIASNGEVTFGEGYTAGEAAKQFWLAVNRMGDYLNGSKKQALWGKCQGFIREQEIHCADTIGQCDRVIENAYDFIQDVCEIVGYCELPED